MSVERMINTAPKGANFAEYAMGRAEFKRDYSRMRNLADLLFHEGRAGLTEAYELAGRHIRPVPRNPLSPALPLEAAEKARLNGSAVLWGTLFTTVEGIAINRVYNPNAFFDQLGKGFAGSDWANSITQNNKRVEFYSHEKVKDLTHTASTDKSFSFLLTHEGFHLLPVALRDDLVMTGFYHDMATSFGNIYRPLAKSVLSAPLTDTEIRRMVRHNLPSTLTAGNPLRFR